MTPPCINCKKPYPTEEFLDHTGLCIICGGKPKKKIELPKVKPHKLEEDTIIEIDEIKIGLD